MQRWIVVAALLVSLLGGATVAGVWWNHRQNKPDKRWVPLEFNPDLTEAQRQESVLQMRENLLTDAVLTGVVRDCDVQGEWELPSEEAAVAELRKRVFVDAGELMVKGMPVATLNIGVRGTVGQKEYLDRLAGRLIEDVRRLIAPQAPASAGGSPPD
jgi:hypothetical protein